MIHGITGQDFTIYIQTEDNAIQPSATYDCKFHLFKFTNDMNGDVQYAYPHRETIYNRYSVFTFLYSLTPSVYLGKVNLIPAGYWKYQVFEVTWRTCPSEDGGVYNLNTGNAPPTEEFVFNPGANDRGVVIGQVTKGKLYMSENSGTEEVTYSQNAKSVQRISIIDGGSGYAVAPTLTIVGGGNVIVTATATCTIDGSGSINQVIITNAGEGYTIDPQIIISGTPTSPAVLIADINITNYIYTG